MCVEMIRTPRSVIEIAQFRPAHVESLLALLNTLVEEGADAWFRPHPFTAQHLYQISQTDDADLYVVVLQDQVVVGYGLLRGWQEGYAIPSLGIALHRDCRGTGLGSMLMEFLHCAALVRGSPAVRLRVRADNTRAIALYRRTGYRFDTTDEAADELLVGVRELAK
jgi:ribosomal protein S18 acetylase RimI-like enzyme